MTPRWKTAPSGAGAETESTGGLVYSRSAEAERQREGGVVEAMIAHRWELMGELRDGGWHYRRVGCALEMIVRGPREEHAAAIEGPTPARLRDCPNDQPSPLICYMDQ